MKYCPGCATALDDNIRKCPQCGHVFADVKPEFESSQRSENENARITSTQPEQPPIYSVPPIVNQNTDNSSTQSQPVPKWKRWLPLLIAISVVGTIMQCCMFSCQDSDLSEIEITEEETVDVDITEFSNSSGRQQRGGFDSSTNIKMELSNYNCEIPAYWKDVDSKKDNESTIYSYTASSDNSDSFVLLACCIFDDPNNESINEFIQKKHLVAEAFMLDEGSNLRLMKQEVMTFGDTTGLLTIFDYDEIINGSTHRLRESLFLFASVEEEKCIFIMLIESDNAKYSYLEDYVSTLKSIKKTDKASSSGYDETSVSSTETTTPIPTPTSTPSPTSTLTPTPSLSPSPSPTPTSTSAPKNTNRYAFKSVASDYSVYYIIDMKEKKVYYFTTYDMKPSIGTIKKGDLKKGITVQYPNDGGTEVISYYKNNTDRIVVKIDGYDFILDSCDLSEAESKLPG